MPNQRLITVPAAARYVGLTTRQFRRLIERGYVTFHDVDGRKLFDPADLDAYLDRIRVEAQ